ncbi:metal ABC transporter solute-binding protein, Zn/Mn family [Hansschlegelia quercus]|uniref:Metal ABC transporter substrate-binding protein n=1 Tax=Hansschlegelia quercus TaxID=2528245 RepID=A0A4Q9GG43_9HYPH|nr:zinc ABC transporter substrate-binding protein [Hansschlegelia quercus]TBN52442.1 metal ABC transporter substrate-binding protein [Hansschlegelia quercus]
MLLRSSLSALCAAASMLLVQPAAAKTLETVASFTVLADVVKNVGGDHVNVTSLVPPNGDPHAFEPSPDDARRLKAADLAFVSDPGFETWFPRLAKAAGAAKPPVAVSKGVKTIEMEEEAEPGHDHGHGKVRDPHVWNSPANVLVWVGNIEKALSLASPEDAADFHANAARYADELKAVNAYGHQTFDDVAKEKRKVLTSHDAFGYFGAEYGVTFLSPLGVTTEAEPSARAVAALIKQIRAEKVGTYFLESSNDPRLIRQIAEATGAQPGGELYPEALSTTDGPAPTYLKMIRYNIDKIAGAMGK